jgi:hypothetical protein
LSETIANFFYKVSLCEFYHSRSQC